MSKPSVAWYGVARSPYNDFLFSVLAQHYDLTVAYQHRSLATHPWRLGESPYHVVFADDGFDGLLTMRRRADAIVMCGWNDLRWLALMATLPRDRPTAFWTDTPNTNNATGLLRQAIVRGVFQRFDEVWSTGAVGCQALAEIGCPPSKTRSLPFFVDLERPARVSADDRRAARALRESHGGESVVLLGVGQLVARKEYQQALTAVARVDDAVLWLCGDGPLAGELRRLARSLGVERRVFFLGWREPLEVEHAFMASDVFVHPASYDPFPTVVLDAMNWGRPVVGSSVAGSVRERVKDGVSGFVHAPDNIDAMARAIGFFVSDRSRIETFGRNARETACAFPVQLAVDRVAELIARGRA